MKRSEGGWVQNMYVTSDEGLFLVVFWHPDPKFVLDTDTMRVYRGHNQCTADNIGPTMRAAP